MTEQMPQGLAGMSAGQPQGQMPQGPGQQMPTVEEVIDMLEEVIDMLLQGAKPEELVQMGIPEELIMQAMQMLQNQAAPEQGLASSVAGQHGMNI